MKGANMKTFEGPDLTREDYARLENQFDGIFRLMSDGTARTLGEIESITGYPAASISAQLRHARKKRFGSHTVDREYLGGGLYTYRLTVNRGDANGV
jgi:hypothetical protein